MRLGGGQVGPLHCIVKLDQHGAGLDLLVGAEADFGDNAGTLDGQVHALRGADGAKRLDIGRPADGLHRLRRHGNRGDRHVGEELLDGVVAENVESDDTAANQDKENEGY